MRPLVINPQQFPVDQVAGESALVAERLTPCWIRHRFMTPARWTPEADSGQKVTSSDVSVSAAVLIPLIVHDEGVNVLLTRRHANLRSHAGQISFPGGRCDAADGSAVNTALREAQEEVGLAADVIDVIGELPPYLTGTGFLVTPVIGLIKAPLSLLAQPEEVTEIFEVPLAFLMDGNHHQRRIAHFETGASRTFYSMEYGPYFIWGVSALILRNLFHFLRA